MKKGKRKRWENAEDYTYKWPYNWVTGVITPITGVITILITGSGPILYD